MTEAQAIAALSAMASQPRLAVLRQLIRAAPEGRSAGDIAAALSASPSRTSFHLSVLSEAGLVDSTRAARHVVYRARLETAGALIGYLLEDCCADRPEIRACCGLSSPS
ncbi:MAG: metalloregulator ArsR/SmtB family transcription factor [Pseudomonadota bacterium]